MTAACARWAADDFLTRAGFVIVDRHGVLAAVHPDGRVLPVPPVCGHNPGDCPPHTTPTASTLEEAA